MAEREYYDYYDWLEAGGDPAYGGAVSNDPGQVAPPEPYVPAATPTATTTTTTAPPPYDPEKPLGDKNKPPAPFPGYEWYWTDENGWRARPIGGTNQAPPSAGPSAGAPSTSADFDGGGGAWPTYNQPAFEDPGVFDPGDPFSYPEFSYADFVGPRPEQINDDPSFQWRMDQGRKALEASAAGKGILRSGGSMKDLLRYGQNFASQEYGNIWNRALTEYDTNRDNAFGSWNANRSNAFDTWNTAYTGRKDAYGFSADRANNLNAFNLNNSQFDFTGRNRQAEFDREQAFQKWLAEGNWLTDLAVGGLNS